VKVPLRKRFGKTVKALRLASGVSQEAFADKCGFARSYVSRIERGGANPSLDAVEVLAIALSVEVKALFETSGLGADAVKTSPRTISVPFASDGSFFNPSLRRTRTGKFTVGERGNEVAFDTFDAAVEYLKTMETAYWRRPNEAGNWGRVVAVRWGALPKKY
jgi:transcriptional regulator with XRE-family HTH domain